MKKRFVSIFLALTMSIFSITPVFADDTAETGTENPSHSSYAAKITSVEPIFLQTYDGFTYDTKTEHGFDNVTSALTTIPAIDEESEHGRYFSVIGEGRIEKTFSQPLKGGRYFMTFDFMRSEAENWFYIRQGTTENVNYTSTTGYAHGFACASNKVGYNNNWSIAGAKTMTPGEWVNVGIYLDLDKKLQYLYIDNEFCQRASFASEYYGFALMVQSSATNVTSIDNFALYKFSTELGTELKNMGIEYPEEFGMAVDLSISSANSGNIFGKEEDVLLNVAQKNGLSQPVEYDIDYVVKNWRGDEVWRHEEKDVKLAAGETVTEELRPKIDKFDIYTLNVTATPKDETVLPSTIKREFSYVNTPTYGYKNYDIGACTHPGRHTTWSDVIHAVDIAGIGYTRTDNTEAENKTPDFWEYNMNLGIQNNSIFYIPTNLVEGKTMSYKEMSQSPEYLEKIEAYAEEHARKYIGKITTFELGNEINFNRIQVLSPEEYAICSQAAYRGLKKGNPDCIVLSCGLSRSAGEWVYRYLMTPGGKSCDVLAIHLYQEAGTPEAKKFEDYCMEVKDGMKRAGCEDMEMWITEGNTSSHAEYSTEQQHAVNLVRHFPMMATGKYFDKMFFYQLQTIENNENDIESYFGILHGPYVDDANGAKMAYVALSNYIAMTENAEYESDMQEDKIYAYRFKRSDGKRVLMMYTDRCEKTLSLNLGATEGTMYDMCGNPTSVSSENGCFTFALSDEPLYFIYEGDSFEKCEPVVSLNKNKIEFTKGSTGSFELTVPEGAKVSFSGMDNVTLQNTQSGNVAKVDITVNELPEIHYAHRGYGNTANVAYTEHRQDFGTQIYRDFVRADVKKDGKMIASLDLPIEYVYPQADIHMVVRPYDESNLTYWKAIVKITNNNLNKSISGKVVMDTPTEMAKNMKEVRVENIAPGETKEVSFNLPPKYSHGWLLYSGRLVLDDGDEVSFALGDVTRSYGYNGRGSTATMPVKKVKGEAPVIDGIINEDEWKEYKMTSFDKSQVSYGSQGIITAGVVERETFGADADYGGKEDFSGTIYAQWDDDYLYAAAIVYDDVHFQKQDPVRFYYEDMFYLDIKPTTTQRHDTRIEFALSDFFNSDVYTDADRKAVIYRNWSQMFDVCVGGVIPQTEDGFKAEIIRKDNVTVYEVRLPWKEIISPEIMEDKGTYLSFGIRDYDGDRDKTYGWGGWFVPIDQ